MAKNASATSVTCRGKPTLTSGSIRCLTPAWTSPTYSGWRVTTRTPTGVLLVPSSALLPAQSHCGQLTPAYVICWVCPQHIQALTDSVTAVFSVFLYLLPHVQAAPLLAGQEDSSRCSACSLLAGSGCKDARSNSTHSRCCRPRYDRHVAHPGGCHERRPTALSKCRPAGSGI